MAVNGPSPALERRVTTPRGRAVQRGLGDAPICTACRWLPTRALSNLSGVDGTTPAKSPPRCSWSPCKLEDGSWTSFYLDVTVKLSENLVAQGIKITTKGVDSWTSTVVEVIRWENVYLLRHSGKPE